VSHRWHDPFRGLERRLKILTIAALRRLMPRSAPRPAPEWGARPHRILYLRYDHIGDMVLVTGIFHAIKLAQPTVTIDVLASVRNAAVLSGNPDVGTVYRVDKARPWSFLPVLARVRRVRYDAVLDPMVTGASLTSMLIMWASGALDRIGVAGRGNDFALTLPVPKVPGATHYVDHSAALLQAFGIDPACSAPQRESEQRRSAREQGAPSDRGVGWDAWRPRLFLTPAELAEAETYWRLVEGKTAARGARRPRRLLVNVSAGAPWRRWSEERFIATIRGLRARFADLPMVLLGAPADEPLKSRVARACGLSVAQTAHIRQMMALVATCDLVFTPDTSVTHIASALRKPVVVMFARNGSAHWGPYGSPGRIVSTPARALAALPVQPVLQALEQMLCGEQEPPSRGGCAAGG
jgi:ADP-heptose:LPS heptosyltransferase